MLIKVILMINLMYLNNIQKKKKLGAISSEELSFDKSRDFIIPRPFTYKT